MPSTVIANTELAQGGLVLLSQSANFSDDGTHDYRADYACLSQFAGNHTGKFVKGAPPPIERPAQMARSAVKLYDVRIERERGITYFRASYGGFDFSYEETTTEVIKTFSHTEEFQSPTFGSQVITRASVTFDYVSTTATTTSKSRHVLTRSAGGLVGPPVNLVRTSQVFILGEPSNVGGGGFVQFRPDRVVTKSTSRAASGQKTYTTTMTGIYIPYASQSVALN
jgi:hypothetical protein